MQQKEQTAKWLLGLLYLGIAHLALSVIGDIMRNDLLASWIQLALNAGIVVCLFALRPAQRNYRFAATFRGIAFLLSAAGLLIGSILVRLLASTGKLDQLQELNNYTSLLAIFQMAASLLAVWFENLSHGSLVEEAAPALAKKWRTLFFWQLAASVFYSIGTAVAAPLVMFFQWDITTTYALILSLLQLPGKALKILYILYLYRTIRLVRE